MSEVAIASRDYWFKVVDFLQHNWALIESSCGGEECTVYFFGDACGVFDRMAFVSEQDAERALLRNEFTRYEGAGEFKQLVSQPRPPFHEQVHPNGPIYSSGRFWR